MPSRNLFTDAPRFSTAPEPEPRGLLPELTPAEKRRDELYRLGADELLRQGGLLCWEIWKTWACEQPDAQPPGALALFMRGFRRFVAAAITGPGLTFDELLAERSDAEPPAAGGNDGI